MKGLPPIYSMDTRDIEWRQVFKLSVVGSVTDIADNHVPKKEITYIGPEGDLDIWVGENRWRSFDDLVGESVRDYAVYCKSGVNLDRTLVWKNLLNTIIKEYRLPTPKEVDKWKMVEALQ